MFSLINNSHTCWGRAVALLSTVAAVQACWRRSGVVVKLIKGEGNERDWNGYWLLESEGCLWRQGWRSDIGEPPGRRSAIGSHRAKDHGGRRCRARPGGWPRVRRCDQPRQDRKLGARAAQGIHRNGFLPGVVLFRPAAVRFERN